MNEKTNKFRLSACIVLVVAIIIGVVAGMNFHAKRTFVQDIVAGPGVTDTFMLSEYNENLAGT